MCVRVCVLVFEALVKAGLRHPCGKPHRVPIGRAITRHGLGHQLGRWFCVFSFPNETNHGLQVPQMCVCVCVCFCVRVANVCWFKRKPKGTPPFRGTLRKDLPML